MLQSQPLDIDEHRGTIVQGIREEQELNLSLGTRATIEAASGQMGLQSSSSSGFLLSCDAITRPLSLSLSLPLFISAGEGNRTISTFILSGVQHLNHMVTVQRQCSIPVGFGGSGGV